MKNNKKMKVKISGIAKHKPPTKAADEAQAAADAAAAKQFMEHLVAGDDVAGQDLAGDQGPGDQVRKKPPRTSAPFFGRGTE